MPACLKLASDCCTWQTLLEPVLLAACMVKRGGLMTMWIWQGAAGACQARCREWKPSGSCRSSCCSSFCWAGGGRGACRGQSSCMLFACTSERLRSKVQAARSSQGCEPEVHESELQHNCKALHITEASLLSTLQDPTSVPQPALAHIPQFTHSLITHCPASSASAATLKNPLPFIQCEGTGRSKTHICCRAWTPRSLQSHSASPTSLNNNAS